MSNIKIVVRDINGKWNEKRFETREEAYQYCLNLAQEESDAIEEIMYITVDGACVYSSLMAEGVDWETLVGWFA